MIRKNIWIVRDDLRVSGVYHQQLRPTSGRSINMLELSVRTVSALFPMRIGLQRSVQMKHVVASLTIGACLLLSSAGVAFAVNAHNATTVAPNPATGATGITNGTGGSGVAGCMNGGTAPGTIQGSPPGQANNPSNNSPFPTTLNPSPTPNYAGATASPANSGPKNPNSNAHPNSQYDNACFQHQMP